MVQTRAIRTPTDAEVAARLRAEAMAVGVALTAGQVSQLTRYLDLVRNWRRQAGLTAVADPLEAARVHIADSLLCLRAGMPEGAALVDVGSGAGLPGIPLAIVRPDLRITLLEGDQRKAAFLEMAASALDLPAAVVARRAEDAGRDPVMRERANIVAARAVAPLPVLLELTLPLLAVGGTAVFLKGPRVHTELSAARNAAEQLGAGGAQVIDAALAGGEKRNIVVLRKFAPTPHGFPRRPGVPGRRPLR